LLREELNQLEGKAREGLAEAAASLKSGALEVKDSIKEDLRAAFTDAKQSLRAATVGRVEALATTLGDKMNDTKVTLIETVRANPIPAAMIGAGIVWMLMNRSRSARTGPRPSTSADVATRATEPREDGALEVEQRVSQVAHQAMDQAKSALHSASGAVGAAVHDLAGAAGRAATQAGARVKTIAQGVGSAAGQVYSRAASGAHTGLEKVNQGYSNALQENPLLLAGAALAIGAIVGFALPRTGREDALLGPARDTLLRRAGQTAQQAASSLANLAEDAMESAAPRSAKEPARA